MAKSTIDRDAVTSLPKGWVGMDKSELREIRKTAQIMRRMGKNQDPRAFLFLSVGHWPVTMEQMALEIERLHKKMEAAGIAP